MPIIANATTPVVSVQVPVPTPVQAAPKAATPAPPPAAKPPADPFTPAPAGAPNVLIFPHG